MPQDRSLRRRHSRSQSQEETKHKRSWQPTASSRERSSNTKVPRRSLSPASRGSRGSFKTAPKFDNRRDFAAQGSQNSFKQSHNAKKHRAKSPVLDRDFPPAPNVRPSNFKFGDSAVGGDRGRESFKRGASPEARHPGPPPKKRYSSPGARHISPDVRKKKPAAPYRSVSPVAKRKTSGRVRSLSPRGKKEPPSRHRDRSLSLSPPPKHKSSSKSQRKISVGDKKKVSRTTLNSRFTPEDQEPFRLEENVTIAILRNPKAQASEEVTVKRVFDSSKFQMIHKKTEGKRPIFDREEIRIWRHDDNLADDPDFERRLIRVKSTGNVKSKKPSDSLARMSPDTLRKTFGLQIGGHSRSRSPRREQKIKLDPKPDPKYEKKYRQEMEREREESSGKKKREGDIRNIEDRKSRADPPRKDKDSFSRNDQKERNPKVRPRADSREDKRADKRPDTRDSRGETRGETRGERGERGEVLDLRQALNKRRDSSRDKPGFRVEVQRGDREGSTELYYRDGGHQDRDSRDTRDGRNVVVDTERERHTDRHEDRRDFRQPWVDRGRGGRGRGRGVRGGGDWSQDRHGQNMQEFGEFDRGNNQDRRQRFGSSSPPPSTRGWRGNREFRGRGRGRGSDFDRGFDVRYTSFDKPYDKETALETAQEIDDRTKYVQHDDRDISPKMFRGRGGRGRFISRGFGSSSFRANSRGFRGGFRGNNRFDRGRGAWNNVGGDRGSLDQRRELSSEREWKHDMYDSLQAEENSNGAALGN